MYRLINARPSPYGRKVAVALHEKQLPFETLFDLPWGEAVETQKHSPFEQLPILLVHHEQPVFDSTYILQWLELRHPTPALLPENTAARLQALRLQMVGERLMEIAQGLIFEHHRPEPSAQLIDRATRKIFGGLAEAERSIGNPPNEGEPIHLGHIALATTLIVWEFVVEEGMSPPIDALVWRGRRSFLTEFVEKMEQRRSFVATRPQSMTIDMAAEVS